MGIMIKGDNLGNVTYTQTDFVRSHRTAVFVWAQCKRGEAIDEGAKQCRVGGAPRPNTSHEGLQKTRTRCSRAARTASSILAERHIV